MFCCVALCLFFGLLTDVISIYPGRSSGQNKRNSLPNRQSKKEAAKFFPVYFELQDKKKKLNDESWDLMRKGKDDKTTEAQYAEINDKIANNRIAADQLDKTYLGKFKKILSSKKIFLVQRAEMRFHREMIKGMNRGKDKGNDSKKK